MGTLIDRPLVEVMRHDPDSLRGNWKGKGDITNSRG